MTKPEYKIRVMAVVEDIQDALDAIAGADNPGDIAANGILIKICGERIQDLGVMAIADEQVLTPAGREI